MPAHVRRALAANIEEESKIIAQYQVAMALETENKRLDPDIVLTAVKTVFNDPQKGFYLLAEIDGTIVGSLLITFEWSDWRNGNIWYIQSVFVDPDFRGRGAFKQMYHAVMEEAKLHEVVFIRLYVETENEKAQQIYESLGMKRMPYFMYDVKVE